VPVFTRVKVHRDFHVEIAQALYSVSEHLIGQHLDARADAEPVKLSSGARLVKTHPRQPPGGRSIDRANLPEHKAGYAMRDLAPLIGVCAGQGQNFGIYAERLRDDPLPWTRMRAVYRLPGLVRRYGPNRWKPPARARWTSRWSRSPRSPRCWPRPPKVTRRCCSRPPDRPLAAAPGPLIPPKRPARLR